MLLICQLFRIAASKVADISTSYSMTMSKATLLLIILSMLVNIPSEVVLKIIAIGLPKIGF